MSKKSVKFSSQPPVSPSIQEETIVVSFLPRLIPFHLLPFIYIFTIQDFLNITPYLIKQNIVLTLIQLIYSWGFIDPIKTSKKIGKKHSLKKQLDHHSVKQWHLLPISWIISIAIVFPIYVLLVLFGSPFVGYFKENLIASWFLSILSIPYIFTILQFPNFEIYKFIGPLALGCWLSAIVIPLDWDRDWQTWPIPLIFGGYLGGILSYFGSLL